MSDVEEPVAKMSKIEVTQTEAVEELDEGQEEWLSEGILTDDDCNLVGDQEKSDLILLASHDEAASQNSSMEQNIAQETEVPQEQAPQEARENIEQTLNNLENSKDDQEDFPEELGAFLIRKADGRVVETTETPKDNDTDLEDSVKQSDDDGHDTDELLRMLGEDNSKKKTENASLQSMKVKSMQQSSDDDDDEYIFGGAKVTRLRVAKNVLMNTDMSMKRLKVAKGAMGPMMSRKAPKAVPEDTSDREADNHVSTTVKLKGIKTRPVRLPSKATSEDVSDPNGDSDVSDSEAATVQRMFGAGRRGRGGIHALRTVTQRVVSIDGEAAPSRPRPQIAAAGLRSLTRPSVERSREQEEAEAEEERWSGSEGGRQRPERMREDPPSDADSRSDPDSFYDGLPSSDSDDFDDWFTLDVRAERAGDYIPLLGARGRQLLAEERARVAARLGTLQQSVAALAASARAQADRLRLAHASLAQLDAALRAS